MCPTSSPGQHGMESVGLQLKPHTLPLSKQAVALKNLLGKGSTKGSNKGKAAGKGKVGTTPKSSQGP